MNKIIGIPVEHEGYYCCDTKLEETHSYHRQKYHPRPIIHFVDMKCPVCNRDFTINLGPVKEVPEDFEIKDVK